MAGILQKHRARESIFITALFQLGEFTIGKDRAPSSSPVYMKAV